MIGGRQASDDDQGVVPLLLAEHLNMAAATLARKLEMTEGELRITRVTPDGDELVQGKLPALVTVSNELGTPRFPSAKAKMAARKMAPTEITATSLGLGASELAPRAQLLSQFVPQVHGNCEFIQGSPADAARELLARLRADRII
ncbi:MAG: hypothetical protein IPP88_09580 [Betaproteobacteria bacterium]|nr:hypothetical protein [Betaproteobacteria bacterium]